MHVRVKAFLIHLGISTLVVSLAFGLVFGVWYPPPFSFVQDVFGVAITLVAVDLVVGPLLTLIVYKPGKKSLKLDLAMVGLMQVVALCYGLLVCFESRPVYAVYNAGRFSTVNPDEYIDAENAKTPKNHPYPRYSLTGPEWIGARAPSPLSDQDRFFISFSTESGGGMRIMPRLYTPYASIAKEAAAAGTPVEQIDFDATTSSAKTQPGHDKRGPATASERAKVRQWVQELGVAPNKVVLVPLVGSKRVGIVALDAGDGRILDSIGVAPWWRF
jgi:hypothetical protein